MKKSRYNIFAEWNNFFCGVNLFSGNKIVLFKNDYEYYLNDPQQMDEKMYSALIKGGFIIEDDVNEYSKLIHKRNNDVFFNNNVFQLTILPTLECNFRCWYCYEQHLKGNMTSQTYEKLKRYVNYILDSHPIFCFHLDWFGGEPLLYFKEIVKPFSLFVKSICEQKSIYFRNTITTNGFLINKEMVEEFNEIELTGFQITLDGYKDLHNKIRFETRGDDTYTKIIDNINNICQIVDKASINIRINYTNNNILELGRISDDLHPTSKNKVYVSMQRVWQTRDIQHDQQIKQNLDKEIEYIRKNDIKVNNNHLTYNKGVRCYADTIWQSVVNYDGSLFKCTARNFADHKASIGSLNDNGVPKWNSAYYQHFLKPVFDNPECKKCCYLPICLGNCSQKYIENGDSAIEKECNPHEWAETINEELLQSLYEYITKKTCINT